MRNSGAMPMLKALCHSKRLLKMRATFWGLSGRHRWNGPDVAKQLRSVAITASLSYTIFVADQATIKMAQPRIRIVATLFTT
jgi:hypothetical protein